MLTQGHNEYQFRRKQGKSCWKDDSKMLISGATLCRICFSQADFCSYAHGRLTEFSWPKSNVGPFVRIAPNEVAVADIDASKQIHRIGSNFRKNPAFYQAMGSDQLDDNTCGVFMLWDPKIASSRRRLFQQAGTKKNIADWEPQVIELTRMLTQKIRADLEENGRCNIMKWFSFLASDVMGELCFGHSFHSIKNGTVSFLTDKNLHVNS